MTPAALRALADAADALARLARAALQDGLADSGEHLSLEDGRERARQMACQGSEPFARFGPKATRRDLRGHQGSTQHV